MKVFGAGCGVVLCLVSGREEEIKSLEKNNTNLLGVLGRGTEDMLSIGLS